ncbi:TetR/AcrR family transcriptional regulator [Aeromicrobium sp. YIM 150415]|nr:TetR/AcrR family transcriptional regulator [Aeromicrobium sp. YIM 150415]
MTSKEARVAEDDNRRTPVTPRGARTRQALIDAARVVFERDGYLDARLTDITAEARCSTGSFYTYFTSKEEIFAAVMEMTKNEMLHPGVSRVSEDDDPVAVIAASNRSYFESYRRNAKLMQLLEQVANVDPRVREVRQERARAFVERNARSIADLQERGLVDPDLDSLVASWALSSMVSRLAFSAFVLKEIPDGDHLVDTCTRLWCNALRL